MDTEFKKLEGKTIREVVKHNGNIIILFTDETYAGIYNNDEIIEGNLDLDIKLYK